MTQKDADAQYQATVAEAQRAERMAWDPLTDRTEGMELRRKLVISVLGLADRERSWDGTEIAVKKRVLEVGAGTCEIGEWLAAVGADAVSLDYAPEYLALSRDRTQAHGTRAPLYVQGDGEELPFSDDAFDMVIFWEVLHHLPDATVGIREAYRVLKPGGSCIAVEPNALSPMRIYTESEIRLRDRLAAREFIPFRHTDRFRIETSFYPWGLANRFVKAGFDRHLVSWSPTSHWREELRARGLPRKLLHRLAALPGVRNALSNIHVRGTKVPE